MLLSFEETSNAMSNDMKEAAKSFIMCKPYLEGVWMTKHKGVYYLQYASPSSRNNVYADGVYVSDSPLGPFKLAQNNPYSYKPGGFIPGAGHGSTMEDKFDNLWHVATMRICMNHNFERRIGIWPAGWDKDGDMFCNQCYGDWPISLEQAKLNPWVKPDWMLISYGKSATASSVVGENTPNKATDENIRTWWKANFADDDLSPDLPAGVELNGVLQQERWIDEVSQPTRWKLEGSIDGNKYFIIEDKSEVDTDLPHDLVVREEGLKTRYIKLTVVSLPYGQAACISGLRVFGLGNEKAPSQATEVTVKRFGNLDIDVTWRGTGTGYVVVWGYAPDKLYHSYQVFGENVRVGGIVKGQETCVRVDSYNDNGITEGDIIKV